MPGIWRCSCRCRSRPSRSEAGSSPMRRVRCSTMSDDLAIRFEQVGKMYKVFGSKFDNLLDALSLPTFRRDGRYREFWALRDIDLELARGARLGIIGRNGAGKT